VRSVNDVAIICHRLQDAAVDDSVAHSRKLKKAEGETSECCVDK
jgi:hypothetical protein